MKCVLITGANRGIGLGFVRYYLEAGWRVVGTSRYGHGQEIFQALVRQYGNRFSHVDFDASDNCSIRLLGDMLHEYKLDLVINNAAVCSDESFGNWSAETFMDGFRLNAVIPALVAQTVAPLMVRGARLVNVTSGMASLELNINPQNGLDAYAMSKAALNMLTRRLAVKLASQGITVIALSPGWVQTDMGGDEAPLTVEESVASMIRVIDTVTQEQRGGFYTENGGLMPW